MTLIKHHIPIPYLSITIKYQSLARLPTYLPT